MKINLPPIEDMDEEDVKELEAISDEYEELGVDKINSFWGKVWAWITNNPSKSEIDDLNLKARKFMFKMIEKYQD